MDLYFKFAGSAKSTYHKYKYNKYKLQQIQIDILNVFLTFTETSMQM